MYGGKMHPVVSLERYAGHHSRWIDVKIKFVEWMRLSLGTHFPDNQLSKFMFRSQSGAIVPSLNHVTPFTHSKKKKEGWWLILSPASGKVSAARRIDRKVRPWVQSDFPLPPSKYFLKILTKLNVLIYSKRDQSRGLVVRACTNNEVPGSIPGSAAGIFPCWGRSPQRPWSG
jgi:hypothetical protein